MTGYEYKVIAAPRRARKLRGVRAGDDRFAATIAETISTEASGGWDYYRAETLREDVKGGWFSARREREVSVLVFRRALARAAAPAAQVTGQVGGQGLSAHQPDEAGDFPQMRPSIRAGEPGDA